jgi:hypothetical protein
MKKALLVAASLFTTAAAVTTGEAVKAEPQFVLTQNSAGNLLFQGIGTAQYNNSIGTNNSFQVGSSTNLGVNASTSSTPEYKVNSHAQLDLASDTTLIQVIGTSGVANAASNETVGKLEWASEKAEEAVLAFEAERGVSFDDWSNNFYGMGWYDGPMYATADEWEAARTKTETDTFKETYNKTTTDTTTSSSSNDMSGIIKGSFTTTESGEAAAGTMTDWRAKAAEDADDEMRAQFNVDWNTFVANDVDGQDNALNTYKDEDEYKAARSNGWTAAYNEAYTGILTSNSRESVSDVEVHGIGSDATVVSRDTSTFDVEIVTTLADAGNAESTATANGAAGANLSTSSFANQSMASTASAFMQAFGGDQVDFVETDTTMGTNTGTGNVGVDPADNANAGNQVVVVDNEVNDDGQG